FVQRITEARHRLLADEREPPPPQVGFPGNDLGRFHQLAKLLLAAIRVIGVAPLRVNSRQRRRLLKDQMQRPGHDRTWLQAIHARQRAWRSAISPPTEGRTAKVRAREARGLLEGRCSG